MKNDVTTVVETIVNTLLQVGDKVVEISREEVICRIWEKKGAHRRLTDKQCFGKKIAESQDKVIKHCADKVGESFSTGGNVYLEHTEKSKNGSNAFAIRILPIHPDKDKLFLVVEPLTGKAGKKQSIKNSAKVQDTEQRLEQQRMFYEHILNNVSADIVVLDSEYRFLYVNPNAVKDEATRKWLIGKTDEEFFRQRNKPMTIPNRRRNMYEAARNERRVIEWVEKTWDVVGNIKYTLRKIYPVFDDKGNLDILIGNSVNVTDFITTQEELKTSRDTFESAFHDSGIGMALLSPDGRWLDANEVLCEMTGYSKEELLKISMRDITFPEERRENKELSKKMLRRELSSCTLERRYISRQGKIVYVLFTLSLVWSKDEMPQFFIVQAVDITKIKELESENIRKNVELEGTKANLINKVSQLEELSYIIAHNLRGPAGNIKLLTEALLAKNEDEPGGNLSGAFSVEEGLGFILEASNSLMNSLSSLMKIAEIKLNKNIPINECDVDAVVNEVTTQLQSAIFEKQASVMLSLEVKVINYPKAYLESILYNFISNALKYHKPGVPPEICINTRVVDERIQLTVKDNGLGIDMERYGSRMFKLNQVFHTGHDSKGFGLYLTKTQVESLGGSIAVVSKINEGSEFVVTF
jgi:PAS domain S-box-containing protein